MLLPDKFRNPEAEARYLLAEFSCSSLDMLIDCMSNYQDARIIMQKR